MKSARLRLVSAFVGLAALTAAAVSACNEKEIAPPVVDGELALKYAQANYDLGPKVFRTEGAKKSAEWIAEQARKISGFEKVGTVRIPPSVHGEYNVEITFPGKKPDFVIVGAHHDTKRLFSVPDFAGANDGASGVGALLAMAAAITESAQKKLPPCTIRLVFFDGEEALYQYTETDGLVGSRAYVDMLRFVTLLFTTPLPTIVPFFRPLKAVASSL